MHIPSIHTKQRARVVYALAFLFAASLTTQLTPALHGDTLTGSTLLRRGDVAVPSKGQALRRKRTYQQVLKVCNDRDGVVDTMVCPDVNDRRAVRTFLSDTPSTHGAAPVEADVLRRSDLAAEDRELLDRYTGRGSCPQTLRRVMPGFYELCLSIAVDPASRSLEALSTTQRRRAERLKGRMGIED